MKMIDIDSLLLEWSVRCSKGYPDLNDPNDLLILKEVMTEMNVSFPIGEIAEQQEFSEFYNLLPSEKQEKFNEFVATMPDSLLEKFKQTMKELSPNEVKSFAEFFKSMKNVEELNGFKYDKFMKLWETYVGQAIGKGELFISFAVDKAVVQGSTESFDIADGKKRYEVKSLDVLKDGKFKYGAIRPGAEGKVSKYLFTKQLMEFYSLVKQLQDQLKDPEMRSAVMSLGEKDTMEKIYDVIDSISVIKPKGGEVLENPGDIPASMMANVYNNVLVLHKIKSVPFNKDVTTSRITVKGSLNANATYWISPEDADAIVKASDTEAPVNIKIGTLVSDETKEAKIVLTDLFNHPFVTKPETFTDSLYGIKKTFLGDKAGLIYFLNKETIVSPEMAEFATIESSQDGYRFGLKSKHSEYKHVEDQK